MSVQWRTEILRVFEGWSLAHFILDAALTAVLTMIIGRMADIPLWLQLVASLLIFLGLASGFSVWRQERGRATTSIADLCEELALKALRIDDQEAAKDLCGSVLVALFVAGHSAESTIFQNLTQPLFKEKPGKELIIATLGKASILLRATAVRIRKVESMAREIPEDVRSETRRLYDETLAAASSVDSCESAKTWAERAGQVLVGTGQQLKLPEFKGIVDPLWKDGADVPAIIQRAVEFLKAITLFLGAPSSSKRTLLGPDTQM